MDLVAAVSIGPAGLGLSPPAGPGVWLGLSRPFVDNALGSEQAFEWVFNVFITGAGR